MADFDGQSTFQKETALQALTTIIQLHLEKTLEKKHSIDKQKKELWRLFQHFFLFLALVFAGLAMSSRRRLECRHCWIPITFLSFSHLIFYVSVAQTLRCINGFKYQRRCHKLTLGVATDRMRKLRSRMCNGEFEVNNEEDEEFEVNYQEPPESYYGKLRRNWVMYFGFLVLIYGFMVSSSVVLLCA